MPSHAHIGHIFITNQACRGVCVWYAITLQCVHLVHPAAPQPHPAGLIAFVMPAHGGGPTGPNATLAACLTSLLPLDGSMADIDLRKQMDAFRAKTVVRRLQHPPSPLGLAYACGCPCSQLVLLTAAVSLFPADQQRCTLCSLATLPPTSVAVLGTFSGDGSGRDATPHHLV